MNKRYSICLLMVVLYSLKSLSQPFQHKFAVASGEHFYQMGVADFEHDGDYDTYNGGAFMDGDIFRVAFDIYCLRTSLQIPYILDKGHMWSLEHSDIHLFDFANVNDVSVLMSGLSFYNDPRGANEHGIRIHVREGIDQDPETTYEYVPNLKKEGLIFPNIQTGDIDNDGDDDIVMIGINKVFQPQTMVFLNKYPFIEEVNTEDGYGLMSLHNGSVDICDIDNDQDNDLLISGLDADGNTYIILYANENGRFLPQDVDFELDPLAGLPSMALFSDLNADGLPDVFVGGNGKYTAVYENLGNRNFQLANSNFAPFIKGDCKFMDFNGDNLNDIVYSYHDTIFNDTADMKVYFNAGNFEFNLINIDKVNNHRHHGEFAIKDCNYDSLPDIFIKTTYREEMDWSIQYLDHFFYTGENRPEHLDPPTELSVRFNGTETYLRWNDPYPDKNYSFNIYMGTEPGQIDITSPLASLETGKRWIIEPGNAGYDTAFMVKGLIPGETYYFAVQTIDTYLAGSAFSDEYEFTMVEPFVNDTLLTGNFMTFDIADYDMDDDYDIFVSGTSEINRSGSYILNSQNNGEFDTIPVSDEIIQFGDVVSVDADNDNDPDIFCYGQLQSQPGLYKAILFENSESGYIKNELDNFPQINNSEVKATDFNNDGYIDLLLYGNPEEAGMSGTYICLNNKTGGFIVEEILMSPLDDGMIAVGDLNNDSRSDFIVTGIDNTGNKISKIFLNMGDGNFNIDSVSIPGHSSGDIDIFDFNSDRYADVILSGLNGVGKKETILYKNAYDEVSEHLQFSKTQHLFRGVTNSCINTGDMDNNGLNDLFLAGFSISSQTSTYCFDYLNHYYAEDLNLNRDDPERQKWFRINQTGIPDIISASTNSLRRVINTRTNIPQRPSPPTNLTDTVIDYGVGLKWNKGNDPEGGRDALTYNLRIGTQPGSVDILSPLAGQNGLTYKVERGNVYYNSSWIIDSLTPGKYYWSVQSVDNGFLASEWSLTDSFVVSPIVVDFIADTVCFGDTTHFFDQTISLDEIISYSWDFGDGKTSTIQNPLHKYANAGIYMVSLTVSSNFDTQVLQKNVIVKNIPIAGFSSNAVCPGEYTQLINHSDTSQVIVTDWTWDFLHHEPGKIRGSIEKLLTRDEIVTLTIKASNGCSSMFSDTIGIVKAPQNLFIPYNAGTTRCKNDTTQLKISDYTSQIDYQWYRKAGSDSMIFAIDTPSIDVVSSGVYFVKAYIPGQEKVCYSTSNQVELTFLNFSAPLKPVIFPRTYSVCKNDSVLFGVTAPLPGHEYNWYSQDGFVQSGTSYLVNGQALNDTLKLWVEVISDAEVCNINKSEVLPIKVLGVEDVEIEIENAVINSEVLDLCEGEEVKLSAEAKSALEFNWYRDGQGIADSDQDYIIVSEPGVWTLKVLQENGCLSNVTNHLQVNVNALPPIPTFSALPDTICYYDTLELNISNYSDQLDYIWTNASEELTRQEKVVKVPGSEIDDLKLLIENQNCQRLQEISVQVKPSPPHPYIIARGPGLWYLVCNNTDASVYQWYRDGSIMPDANEYIYVADKDLARYHVAISDGNGCFTSSNVLDLDSIAENYQAYTPTIFGNVIIYPNPLSAYLNIEMNNSITGDIQVSVEDMLGSTILIFDLWKENKGLQLFENISMNQLEAGTYILRMKFKQSVESKLIVIE